MKGRLFGQVLGRNKAIYWIWFCLLPKKIFPGNWWKCALILSYCFWSQKHFCYRLPKDRLNAVFFSVAWCVRVDLLLLENIWVYLSHPCSANSSVFHCWLSKYTLPLMKWRCTPGVVDFLENSVPSPWILSFRGEVRDNWKVDLKTVILLIILRK